MMPRIEWRCGHRSARYREVEASYDLLRDDWRPALRLATGRQELVWSGEEELLCARCLSQYKAFRAVDERGEYGPGLDPAEAPSTPDGLGPFRGQVSRFTCPSLFGEVRFDLIQFHA